MGLKCVEFILPIIQNSWFLLKLQWWHFWLCNFIALLEAKVFPHLLQGIDMSSRWLISMWYLIFFSLPSFPQSLHKRAWTFFVLPSLCLPFGITFSLLPIKEFILSPCSNCFLQSWFFASCFCLSFLDANFCPHRLQVFPRWFTVMCFFIFFPLPSFPHILHFKEKTKWLWT